MATSRKPIVGLFVDRSCRRWVVRDPEGNFWILPSVEAPWGHREPLNRATETELEPVLGHYKGMLRLRF